ncbi:uncharacterized protein LOC106473261 [Limulus polyphemus]|uniref:Uncharacterized protein LOC106473261 n=1 Tax=Limulus polyphemus TaxID=6850 RepID=A0ABM1BVC9_LIMPO|nr:uncharacterized protein LOC106473261 [Limulus polyphemus]
MLLYFRPGYPGIPQKCPVSLNLTCCQWRLDTSPSYKRYQNNLYFKLHSENIFGTLDKNFQQDHFQIVLPDAPLNLHVINKSQDEINISWVHPKGFQFGEFKPGLNYQLWYRKADTSDKWKIRELGIDTTQYTLSGLTPYIKYEIQVHCQSSKVDPKVEDMWSEFKQISCRTNPDVPYLIPIIRKEAFEQNIMHLERSITLYWQPVPKENYNGQEFYYMIVCQNDHASYSDSIISMKRLEGSVTTYRFDHLELNMPYKFILYSINKEGRSENSSEIFVDSRENVIPKPTNITVINYVNGTHKLQWSYPKEEVPVTSYTVFWCNNSKPRPFSCTRPVSWKTLRADENAISFDFEKDLSYQFAVAANSGKATSGMEWALCIVSAHKPLDKVVIDVYGYNETTLIVKWTLTCKAQKKVIQEYVVQYCQSSLNRACIKPRKQVIVNNSEADEMMLTGGLRPFTMYLVSVQTKTHNKMYSEFSDEVLATTKMGKPTEPLNLRGKTNSTAISITWERPQYPNGILHHYIVWFNERLKKVQHCMESQFCSTVLDEDIKSFTNYSVSVQACNKYFCSNRSNIFYALVDIKAPGIMEGPVIEILNTTTVRVRWTSPEEPNGPVDLYLLHVGWANMQNTTNSGEVVYNLTTVSGSHTLTYFWPDCAESDKSKMFSFQIQAANIKNQSLLVGPLSNRTETRLCGPEGPEAALVIGVVVGSCLGLILLVLVLAALVRWMKNKVDWMNDIKVQLPSGLDAPNSHPFSDYEKFKRDLIRNCSYSNTSPTFDHLSSFSDIAGLTERQGSLNSHCSSSSTDQLLQKKSKICDSYRRNDINNLTLLGGHGSATSIANRTNLSSDSGTEIDLHPPPSPVDGHSEKTNCTPRSCSRPGLPKVEEIQDTNSRDSGLDRDNPDDSRERCFYLQSQVQQPYSRFGQGSGYVSFPGQNNNLSSSHHLANSEPSIHGEEDLVEPGTVPPYSRFGLAKSVGSVIEETRDSPSIQEEDQPSALSYSKFGVMSPINQSRYGNPTVGLVFDHSRPFDIPHKRLLNSTRSQSKPVSKGYVSMAQAENFTVPGSFKEPSKPGLYSKFVVEPEDKNSLSPLSGYVCLQDNISPESIPQVNSIDNKGYSRFGVDPVLDDDDISPLEDCSSDQETAKSDKCLLKPQETSDVNGKLCPTPLVDEVNKEDDKLLHLDLPVNGYVQCPVPHDGEVDDHVENLDLEKPKWTSTMNDLPKPMGISDFNETTSGYVSKFQPHRLSRELSPKNFSFKNNGYVSLGETFQNGDAPKNNITNSGLVVGVKDSEELTSYQSLPV